VHTYLSEQSILPHNTSSRLSDKLVYRRRAFSRDDSIIVLLLVYQPSSTKVVEEVLSELDERGNLRRATKPLCVFTGASEKVSSVSHLN